jgi:hypothetical protein
MRVDIRCPQVVKKLVQKYQDWHIGEAPLSDKPFAFRSTSDAQRFEHVVWHPHRNLPVVAISSYEGTFLTPTFADDLSSDLVGVAIVATLEPEAAESLTRSRGKEWACFNGAVRLYWPQLRATSNPLSNPLWTRMSLLSHGATPQDAAGKIRRQLRRQLLGLSAFAVPEPREFSEIRFVHERSKAELVRTEFRDSNDWQGLADLYSKQNDQLQADLVQARERAQELETEVANLQLALQWTPQQVPEVLPEEVLPPSTVIEAVDIAKRLFANELVFGEAVDTGVAGLAPDAGPPEKILSYLAAVAEMATQRREGRLGAAPVKWFMGRGVNASGESETVKNSVEERRKRTWHDGSSPRLFDLHLKPTDGVHPDRCVRIYLDYDESRNVAVVGWIGRHP